MKKTLKVIACGLLIAFGGIPFTFHLIPQDNGRTRRAAHEAGAQQNERRRHQHHAVMKGRQPVLQNAGEEKVYG